MNHPRLICGLLVAFVSVVIGMDAEAQTWRDKLRDKAQDAKRQWQDSERRCADCGKVIHGRDRCTTCEARRVAERAKGAKENIQERWQQAERRCSVCGKVIHGRATCLECEARRLGAQGRDVARTAADASRQLRETWQANKDRWRAEARAAMDTSARRCTEIIRDPQKRLEYAKKAVAVGLAVELTVIRNVPVMDPDSGRIVSVDTLMRQMASDSGIGGSMGEDPVGTAFLIMVDSDYLFSGARLIPAPDGEYMTLDEALRVCREMPGLMNDAAIGSAGMARTRMQYACRVGDSSAFRQASTEFASAIDSISGSRSSPIAARHLLFGEAWMVASLLLQASSRNPTRVSPER